MGCITSRGMKKKEWSVPGCAAWTGTTKNLYRRRGRLCWAVLKQSPKMEVWGPRPFLKQAGGPHTGLKATADSPETSASLPKALVDLIKQLSQTGAEETMLWEHWALSHPSDPRGQQKLTRSLPREFRTEAPWTSRRWNSSRLPNCMKSKSKRKKKKKITAVKNHTFE